MTTAMCIGFNADKALGIVGSSNPQIETFTVSERNEMRNLPSVKITNAGVNQFSFRNDNKVCFLKMNVLLYLHEGLIFWFHSCWRLLVGILVFECLQ
jgi:hypothetical protein